MSRREMTLFERWVLQSLVYAQIAAGCENDEQAFREFDAVFDRVRGNRSIDSFMTPADKSLVCEATFRRCLEIIESAHSPAREAP